jgi:transposase-like protein
MADLKLVYKANSKDLAESELENLEAKWGKKYALVIKSWNNNWHNLSAYFRYSSEIRRMIYTQILLKDFTGRSGRLLRPRALSPAGQLWRS